MPATIQQDITLCINVTGCHFTGPLVLRRSLSTVLPIVSVKLYSCRHTGFIHRYIIYIYYIFNFLLLFTANISCTAVYLLLFPPFSVTFIRFVNTNCNILFVYPLNNVYCYFPYFTKFIPDCKYQTLYFSNTL